MKAMWCLHLLGMISILGCGIDDPSEVPASIDLPCYPADPTASSPEVNLAFLRMSSKEQVSFLYSDQDTVLTLDSALHFSLFKLLDDDRHPLMPVIAVLQLDRQLNVETFTMLKRELMKAGMTRLRFQGCDHQHIDLAIPGYSSEYVGYHDARVASLLPPQPPQPYLEIQLGDSSTIIAVLEPGSIMYSTGSGEPVNDLEQHIRKHEKVLHLYKPVTGSTYDDLFRFYSEVTRALEMIRGPQEPDSIYLELRRRYPMMTAPYPDRPFQ
jgi:hypothetical protein